MTVNRALIVFLFAFIAVAISLSVADDNDSGSARSAEAAAPAAAGDSEIGPALLDPCLLLPELWVEVQFVMILGTEHEEFILMEEFLTLLAFCQGNSLGGPQAVGPHGNPATVTVQSQVASKFVSVQGTWNPSTRDIMATGVGTVAGFPNVTVELEVHISETGELTGTYTMGAAGELPGGNAGVYELSAQLDLETPTPTSEPTPSDSPTPTGEATPTPTGGAEALVWGNWDCDTGVSTRDNQATLRFVLQQNPLSQTEPCTDIGIAVDFTVPAGGQVEKWGDADCDGEITTRDNQATLRNVLQQNRLGQTEPCPDLGTPILAASGAG